MDRQIVYPGAIPLDTDFLSTNRNMLVAISALTRATLGTNTVADGLACTPTSPASLSVVVAPGSITALGPLDSTDYGSLVADTLSQVVKTGITLAPTTFALTPPATPGQSIDYVIEAAFVESDTRPVVLPYLNAANPAQAYSGPGNSGVAQNTQRIDRVQLQLKAGAAAGTGTQAPPAVDTGWVGLYIVTVDNGQTSVVAGDIAPHPASPLLVFKLPQLTPGFSRRLVFNSSGTFTVPVGVQTVRATVVGAGGGGGGTDGTYAAAGGGAGGYASGTFATTPGTVIAITVGAGGIGGAAGVNAGTGGTSSFGTLCSATGGAGGVFQSAASTPGGSGGNGSGGELVGRGGFGTDGQNNSFSIGGHGGTSLMGGGGRASTAGSTALNGQAPGSGAGGTYNSSGAGGQGASGLVIVEY
jgi:hypothetical protein